MKVILLVDSSKESFRKLAFLIKHKKIFISDTTTLNEDSEYKKLLRNMKKFLKSDSEIMLAKFSGKEALVKYLGDEYSQMLLCLSDDIASTYYTENIQETFLKLIKAFEKGDYVKDKNII